MSSNLRNFESMVWLEYYRAHKILVLPFLCMVLESRLSVSGSSHGKGNCIVFLCQTFDSRSASLHSGVQMFTGGIIIRGNPMLS